MNLFHKVLSLKWFRTWGLRGLIGLTIAVGLQTTYYFHHLSLIKAQSCFTQAMLDTQSTSKTACLYVYDNGVDPAEVWNPRVNRSFALHHGQPCAENIYCTIKEVHFQNGSIVNRVKNVIDFFMPNYRVGFVCPGETIRPAHLQPGAEPINDPSDPICSTSPSATPKPPTLTPIPPTLTPKPPTPIPTPTITITPTISITKNPTISAASPDVNGDRWVNLFDFNKVINNFSNLSNCSNTSDVNHDCLVNKIDLDLIINHYSKFQ